MRSVTSWFNPTLFTKNLKRFWPVWGLYLTIWMFCFPIGLFMGNHTVKYFAYRDVLDAVGELGTGTAVVFAVLAAMAVWSYLFNHRSAGLMHQLPIRREGLFLTNYLSGLAFFVIPNAIVFVCTLLAELATGNVHVGNLLIWFGALTLMELFFFSFATVCAMFTGHILALPAFYAILNGLVWGLYLLIDMTLSSFVYGYDGIPWGEELASLLTPVYLLSNVGAGYYNLPNGTVQYYFEGGWAILACAVVGVLFALLALAVYRRRQVEQAGEVVTVRWMRPVFTYGVAFCSALAFGTVMYEIFTGSLPETVWTLLFFMLVCGAAGYFIARMLLEKSFRVFRQWKGCAAFLAVLVVLTCAVEFDLIGYESYVPDAEDVAEVRLWTYTSPGDGAYHLGTGGCSDSEVIAATLAVHEAIVELGDQGNFWNYTAEEVVYDELDYARSGMHVEYVLKNGRTVSRDYNRLVPVIAEDMRDPTSISAKLNALVNMPALVEDSYDLDRLSEDQLVEISLATLKIDEVDYYALHEYVTINVDAWEQVMQAVKRDFAEGNLGRRWIVTDEEYRNTCLINTLEFSVYWKETADGAASTQPEDYQYVRQISVNLQTTAKHTLAALEKTGVLKGQVHLLTEGQVEAVDGKWSSDALGWANINLDEYAWGVIGE